MYAAVLFAVVLVLDVGGTHAQFDPHIRQLGNIVMSIGNHLFFRLTTSKVPPGSENGTFIEQISYIHQMLLKMRDYFTNPPEHLQDQLRSLTQSFSFQVEPQLPKLDIEDKDLKEKYGVKEEDIERFRSMVSDCKTYVSEIIETRGEEVTDKYLK